MDMTCFNLDASDLSSVYARFVPRLVNRMHVTKVLLIKKIQAYLRSWYVQDCDICYVTVSTFSVLALKLNKLFCW